MKNIRSLYPITVAYSDSVPSSCIVQQHKLHTGLENLADAYLDPYPAADSLRTVDVPICLLDVFVEEAARHQCRRKCCKSWLRSRIYIVTNITCSHLHDSSISRITITWCLLLHWIATGSREACTGSRSYVDGCNEFGASGTR
jgi:hypothetical protein